MVGVPKILHAGATYPPNYHEYVMSNGFMISRPRNKYLGFTTHSLNRTSPQGGHSSFNLTRLPGAVLMRVRSCGPSIDMVRDAFKPAERGFDLCVVWPRHHSNSEFMLDKIASAFIQYICETGNNSYSSELVSFQYIHSVLGAIYARAL